MNKRGSSAVFLTIILSALLVSALMLIYAVKENALKSILNSTVNLAGDSVLSEFDESVQKEYGIFIMKGSDSEITEKIKGYIMYMMKDIKDIDIQYVEASGSRFSMYDETEAENQILEYSKLLMTENLKEIRKWKEKNDNNDNDLKPRTLRDGAVIASLPSFEFPKRSLTAMAESIVDSVAEINMVFKNGTKEYLFDTYIMNIFNNKMNKISDEHFFKNEVEYILGGEISDVENEQKVKMAIYAMRMPLNMAHIYSDNEKRNAIVTLAQTLTPGAAAAATQLIVAAAWAYAETDNDIRLLYKGYKVPVLKDKKTWAVGIENIAEGMSKSAVIPQEDRGCDYSQYLRILLFFQDKGLKTSRILDLIQINERAFNDKRFLINEYFTGIDIVVKANGRKYVYEKRY